MSSDLRFDYPQSDLADPADHWASQLSAVIKRLQRAMDRTGISLNGQGADRTMTNDRDAAS